MKLTKFSVTAFLGAMAMCGGSALAQAPVVKASDAFSSRNASLKREYAAVIPTAYSMSTQAQPSQDGSVMLQPETMPQVAVSEDDGPLRLIPDPIAGISFGGWTSVGYHSAANNFSFNTFPDNVQLGQQWLWAEKIADGSNGFDVGGRIDYLYGTDAPDTQAFGTTAPHWDAQWDNGLHYGHAIPQLYGEVAMGDLSVKLGKFFTIIGNEVVGATGNFFYSRQFMFYNAEPFTHTGALSTYNVSDDTQLFNGYVLGWDSGFEDNGDAYLGGFKHKLNDTWSVLYSSCVGRFNDRNTVTNGENGWIHSVIFTGGLTEDITYISQWDAMQTENRAGARVRNTVGTNQYLILKLTDKLSLGQRVEWFNATAPFAGVSGDVYNYTVGLNYAYNSNLLFRPEIRQVWDKTVSPTGHIFNENGRASQLAAGGDMVFVF